MKRIVLCVLLLGCALPPVAAPAQKRRNKRGCMDTAHTQLELNVCADREFREADAALNRVYGQLAARLDVEMRDKLKQTELVWIKYRDTNCDYEAAHYEGGSIRPMIYSMCLARMTDARTAELKEQLKELDN